MQNLSDKEKLDALAHELFSSSFWNDVNEESKEVPQVVTRNSSLGSAEVKNVHEQANYAQAPVSSPVSPKEQVNIDDDSSYSESFRVKDYEPHIQYQSQPVLDTEQLSIRLSSLVEPVETELAVNLVSTNEMSLSSESSEILGNLRPPSTTSDGTSETLITISESELEKKVAEESIDFQRKSSLRNSEKDRPASLLLYSKKSSGKVDEPFEKRWPWKRIVGWTCFVLLFLSLVFIGIFFAFINGKIWSWEDFKLNGNPVNNPNITPSDPSQQLIITSAPSGLAGCSNVPYRAAKRGFQIVPDQQYFEYDLCPDGSFRYTVTECDVLMMMDDGRQQIDSYFSQIKPYVEGLIYAMEKFDINCARNRIVTFLAQIKHETNALKTHKQTIDGGAGAVHMIPEHFSLIINDVDYLKDIYENKEKDNFANKYSLSALRTLGKNYKTLQGSEKAFVDAVGDMLARPDTTFMVAGWWFKMGSNKRLGHLGCGDLRKDSDEGRGKENPLSGYYKVTECIYGAKDPGLNQRLEYFDSMEEHAKKIFKCQTKECPKETKQ